MFYRSYDHRPPRRPKIFDLIRNHVSIRGTKKDRDDDGKHLIDKQEGSDDRNPWKEKPASVKDISLAALYYLHLEVSDLLMFVILDSLIVSATLSEFATTITIRIASVVLNIAFSGLRSPMFGLQTIVDSPEWALCGREDLTLASTLPLPCLIKPHVLTSDYL